LRFVWSLFPSLAMSYRVKSIELYVRETPPGRVAFALGRQGAERAKPTTNPLGHVRMVIADDRGNESFGCSADRLSVRWLDKRPDRTQAVKLKELVSLIESAAAVYRDAGPFASPFAQWRAAHPTIMKASRAARQEDLTGAFASALMERAMLDAVARLAGKSMFNMVREDRLGFRPGEIHRELGTIDFTKVLPARPRTRFAIRHTVGLADPLTADNLDKKDRAGDGLPETLEEYIRTDGLRYFKVKISGDPTADVKRLARLWEVVPADEETAITLDANEAYEDLAAFERFVTLLARTQPGLFDHILYIEQPLPRPLTLEAKTKPAITRLARLKPLLIDEADGTVDAYRRAFDLGYDGASHKNCKGFFKSLLNRALVAHFAKGGRQAFLSGEDLQNLPIVPLHQDFVSLSILDLAHCERNGHHYNYGLSFVSPADKASVAAHHRDLYVRRGEEWFLNIRDGHVECASLQCPGFGVHDEPDWKSMPPMRRWLAGRGTS